MEALLDLADTLALVEQPDRPDFPIPEEYSHLQDPNIFLKLCDSPGKGKGWFAAKDLPAGTIILVVKPIAMIMDWEEETRDENLVNNNDSQTAPQSQLQSDEVAMEYSDRQTDDAGEAEDDEDAEEEEDDDAHDLSSEEEDEPDPRLNELLLLDILEALQHNPNLWIQHLSTIFPRNDADLSSLPAWVCSDDAIFIQVEAFLEQLRSTSGYTDEVVKDITRRLPHIIRYNILSVETCSELLSYPGPGGHSSLSGIALYHYPSLFNHSARPNCSRWSIGDIMFFVTNQAVASGQEVCISYIEHDVLCESPYRRNLMLRMDFRDITEDEKYGASLEQQQENEEDGPEMPVVDSDVQNELMSLDPLERLSSIEELLQQATGEKLPEDERPQVEFGETSMDIAPTSGWFQCDIQNLRILQAITLDGMGLTKKALESWEQAVTFCEQKLPPADESCVIVRIQAALCSFHAGETERAQQHALAALQTHSLLFGDGVELFRRRCRRDLDLKLRPASTANNATSPVDLLWPIGSQ